MKTFYMVFINSRDGVSSDQIKKKFDLALDWFRINNRLWIVYSSVDEDRWYARLIEFVKPGGNLFICKLDIEKRHGFMSKTFWEWIRATQKK